MPMRWPRIGNVDLAVKQLVDLAEKEKSPAVDLLVANHLYNLDRAARTRCTNEPTRPSPPSRPPCWNGRWSGIAKENMPRPCRSMSNTSNWFPAAAIQCAAGRLPGRAREICRGRGRLGIGRSSPQSRRHRHGHLRHRGRHLPAAPPGRFDSQNQAGRDSAQCERLIALDLHMDQDWWNASPSPDAVEHDLVLVEGRCRPTASGTRRFNAGPPSRGARMPRSTTSKACCETPGW